MHVQDDDISPSKKSTSKSDSNDRLSSLFAIQGKIEREKFRISAYLRPPAEQDVLKNPLPYWVDNRAAFPELTPVVIK